MPAHIIGLANDAPRNMSSPSHHVQPAARPFLPHRWAPRPALDRWNARLLLDPTGDAILVLLSKLDKGTVTTVFQGLLSKAFRRTPPDFKVQQANHVKLGSCSGFSKGLSASIRSSVFLVVDQVQPVWGKVCWDLVTALRPCIFCNILTTFCAPSRNNCTLSFQDPHQSNRKCQGLLLNNSQSHREAICSLGLTVLCNNLLHAALHRSMLLLRAVTSNKREKSIITVQIYGIALCCTFASDSI
jgi:hypothetical protein